MIKKITILLLLVFYSTISWCNHTNAIDSLKIELSNSKNDTTSVDILITLSQYLRNTGNTVDAEKYAQQAIGLSKKNNYKKGLGSGYFIMGWVKHYLGDYDVAQNYYVQAMKIQESIGDDKGLASTLTTMGIIAIRIGNIDKSLEYYQQALTIKEELKDSIGIGALLNNIAVVYYQLEDFDKAIAYMENALKIYEAIGSKQAQGTILYNLGEYYYEEGEKEKGVKYLQEAHKATLETGDPYTIAMSYITLSSIKLDERNYKEALKLNDLALDYANKAAAKDQIMSVYETYSDIYSAMENYHKAFEYQKDFINIKDSIFNSEKSKQITELAEKYESEKKQKEIELLNKEKEKQTALSIAENKRKNTIIFSIIGGLVLVIIFSVFLFKRFRVTNHQKLVIEEKQKEITDSITYAKRIQEAILPPKSILKNLLPNSFFLYKPKDIVSGDFYWLEQKDNKILFAAVDCTGHGVPGAFVSIVGHNGLTRTVNEFGLTQPAQILNKLNELVEETLRQKDNEVRDGMDISLCSIDFSDNKLEYAGANNPLYLVRNGKILITKADKQPIGGTGENKQFTNHTFELQKDDSIYIFSDGFADQFGGLKDKKYGYAQFRKLLLSIQDKPMLEQFNSLDTEFNNWKGETEQLDDVCVVGVRI
jgi:serine phosphatase RsbU (regulator of sigma subunit)/Tfp pilus assembly protein PilF